MEKLDHGASAGSNPAADEAYVERVVFLTGLPKDGTAEVELKRLFEHYQVETAANGQPCLAVTDASRGYGCVKLQHVKGLEEAIKFLHQTNTLSGDKLAVMKARRKQVPTWFA